MPIEFLTADQEQEYGRYVGPPSTQHLSRYFHLDDADLELLNVRCGNHNKLGFALQLTTARFLGTFLTEPTDVPSNAVVYVAAQLGIRDVACLADYAVRPTTAWEHAAERRHDLCSLTRILSVGSCAIATQRPAPRATALGRCYQLCRGCEPSHPGRRRLQRMRTSA